MTNEQTSLHKIFAILDKSITLGIARQKLPDKIWGSKLIGFLMERLIPSVICLVLLGSAAPVHAHSLAYNLGFRQGMNACLGTYIGKNSAERDDCIAGKLAGEQYRASLTYPYKVGFAHGKQDRLISIGDYACKSFSGALGLLDTPQWECQQGYDAGWAAPINHTAQQMAMTANKQTQAYKIGYSAGANNGTYSACNEFTDRQSHICSNAYDDGFLTIPLVK